MWNAGRQASPLHHFLPVLGPDHRRGGRPVLQSARGKGFGSSSFGISWKKVKSEAGLLNKRARLTAAFGAFCGSDLVRKD